jgi:hypothetical protein
VRLLLDEMWSPAIASELRKRGFDAIAIGETEHASRYAGIPDHDVLARAQQDRRTIVTDNVSDYEQARRDWEARGNPHHGLIYALNPPFNRHRGGAVGQMVRALEQFFASPPAQADRFSRIHFLRAAPRK